MSDWFAHVLKKMASHIDKASIYIDAQELFRVLYDAQFEIPKRDRPVIGTRVLTHCEKICAYFSMSYHTEDKIKYIEYLFAEFEALKINVRLMLRPDRPMLKNESTRNEIRNYIAKIDESVVKWRKYVGEKRQEGHPLMMTSDLEK